MVYETDRRSRTKALVTYAAALFFAAILGLLVRVGVITDHILW
ncbi:hypothetical protein [Sphingomonas phyllosphaerae]|nr:hypothetical protein [Sphingomonas phyllosphaerae]